MAKEKPAFKLVTRKTNPVTKAALLAAAILSVVALVALTPLIAIQVLGLHSRIRSQQLRQKTKQELLLVDDDMVYYQEV